MFVPSASASAIASLRRRRAVRQLLALFALSGTAALSPWPMANRSRAAGMHTRQDAVRIGSDEASALGNAIREMMDRSRKDPGDPKGWLVNARAHDDFCSVPGNSELQVHFCWWFLAWHRAFLVVTERKLREISGKSFAMPYWNWSSDRTLPPLFTGEGSPFANADRNLPSRPISDGEVDFFRSDPARAKLGVAALGARKFQASTPQEVGSSFGGIARPNQFKFYGNNRLEQVPHGPIHNYVGGDMADFATAAKDPIFFAHHGNLDRLWETWRSDPKKRETEPRDPLFLKHQFPFSWIGGGTAVVSVEETMNTERLGYRYDSLEVFRGGSPPPLLEVAGPGAPALRPVLEATVKVPSPRNESARAGRYTLVIDGVAEPSRPMTVEVRVRRAEDKRSAGLVVGSFAAVLTAGKVVFPDSTLRFDVSDAVRRLGTRELHVSLVPLRLGSRQESVYPPLGYRAISIIPGE